MGVTRVVLPLGVLGPRPQVGGVRIRRGVLSQFSRQKGVGSFDKSCFFGLGSGQDALDSLFKDLKIR